MSSGGWKLIAGFGYLLGCSAVLAGDAAAQPELDRSAARPRLYLDCGRDCTDEFYRQELNYFDWVRDRHDADFAILVSQQVASNGGRAYTVTLLQRAGPAIVRTVATGPGEVLASDRAKLLRAALQCLFEALRGTPHEAAFELALPRRDSAALAAVRDGWDHWVLTPELSLELEGEDSLYYMELLASLHVRRITETSKLRSVSRFSRRAVAYVLGDGERVSGHVDGVSERLVYAHSIGRHFAAGALAVGQRARYENLELHVHGGSIVEWNVFPYEENASRQLRFAYQVGAWYSRYFERSASGLFHEVRPYHALATIVDTNQAWGSVQAVVQVNSFIDEPKRWRLAAGLLFSLSLVAGLALHFEGEVGWIHDQIGLRARPPTDREIFLETRELEREFAVEALFGFAYTFGSVHNTIVNPRFGRVDLEDE